MVAGVPVPKVLSDVVRRAMAKSVGDRYSSGPEMVADLDRVAFKLGGRGNWA